MFSSLWKGISKLRISPIKLSSVLYRSFVIDEEAGISSLEWKTLQQRTVKKPIWYFIENPAPSFQNYTDLLTSA